MRATITRQPPALTTLHISHSLIPSSPSQLSLLAVRITRRRLRATIAMVEDWVQGLISLVPRFNFYFCTRKETCDATSISTAQVGLNASVAHSAAHVMCHLFLFLSRNIQRGKHASPQIDNICGSSGLNSNILLLCISSASPSLTHYSAKLPLGAELICASLTHQIFMHLHRTYEPHP